MYPLIVSPGVGDELFPVQQQARISNLFIDRDL
jgi:hypothetical protein